MDYLTRGFFKGYLHLLKLFYKLKQLVMKIRQLLLLSATFVLLYACSKKKDAVNPPSTLNPWDGKYRLEGTLVDAKDPAFVWPGNTYLYNVETLSATQIQLISIDLGFAGHLLKNGINLTFYGTFGLIATFDPATNKITSVTNSYGQPSTSGRSAVLDPSGVNAWDPVTKNIKIKYWMDETGFAGHRTSFDETWVYIGVR
jgi:hypothetical protein